MSQDDAERRAQTLQAEVSTLQARAARLTTARDAACVRVGQLLTALDAAQEEGQAARDEAARLRALVAAAAAEMRRHGLATDWLDAPG